MKATGVVRRIDDLGRIVIPKEIRKNFKINEGDSLEIYVDNNSIILKKYSLLDDIEDFSLKLVNAIEKIYNKEIIITNKEKVIAASSNNNKLIDMDLSSSIKNNINLRSEITVKEEVNILNNSFYKNGYYLVPIIVNSDLLGSIILFGNNILEIDKRMIEFVKTILIKNIEE